MAKPTVLAEAVLIHADILLRSPEGTTLPRKTVEKLLVMGYAKSLEAARRIVETGEAAGLWTRHQGEADATGRYRSWWVEIHAKPNTSPTPNPTHNQGQ